MLSAVMSPWPAGLRAQTLHATAVQGSSDVAMGNWARAPTRLPTVSFLFHFEINLQRANYPSTV